MLGTPALAKVRQADRLQSISSCDTSCRAHEGKARGLYVAACTGFAADNPLGAAADINFWVDSRSYNIVGCTHMILLAGIVDLLIGASEYSVAG